MLPFQDLNMSHMGKNLTQMVQNMIYDERKMCRYLELSHELHDLQEYIMT